MALAAGSWALGYALSPDKQRFLGSLLPEWQFQPLYLAAHLVTLRLFIAVFTRNFAAGAARLDMPPELVKAGFRVILGPAGALLALVVAVPFCIWDYGYLHGPGYACDDGGSALRRRKLERQRAYVSITVGHLVRDKWYSTRFPGCLGRCLKELSDQVSGGHQCRHAAGTSSSRWRMKREALSSLCHADEARRAPTIVLGFAV